MYSSSNFTKNDSEYILQQIEEIKSHVSADASFLLEETDDEIMLLENEDERKFRVILKVKENDILFLVDSTSFSLVDAVRQAKEEVIKLIVRRKTANADISEVKVYSRILH